MVDMAIAIGTCQIKKGLFSCARDAAGVCIYCGRPFCESHGVRLEDGQEICSRRFCVAKRDDLVVHLAYKEAVSKRNEQRQCGLDGCAHVVAGRCVRCSGYFCGKHVDAREEAIFEGPVKVRRMATLCHHCHARRPIWLRM
jgi:hypothetical protein